MGDISSEEFAQYDRQIRLWGLEAQKRLRRADVLIVGLGGLGSEVVKNVVLAGVRSITLLDPREVSDEDLSSQLLITPEHVGRNIAKSSRDRTQELNPNVEVLVDSENVASKDEDFFSRFDVVCATRCPESLRKKLNKICRDRNVKFFCGDVFGFFGYFFTDLGHHEFAVEIKKPHCTSADPKKSKLDAETVTVKRESEFCSYEDALEEDVSRRSRRELKFTSQVHFIVKIIDQFQRNFSRLPRPDDSDVINSIKADVLSGCGMEDSFVSAEFSAFCFSELSPVAAIVGGVLGQEVIKVISKKGEPHNNFFFYDGLRQVGVVDNIRPK